MINYIIASYLGPRRRGGPHEKNCLTYIKEHVNLLKRSKSKNIFPTFVFNGSRDKEEEIKNCLGNLRCQVIFRPNVGFSYGAWEEAIINNLSYDYKYFFLIEDDYIPTNLSSLKEFEKSIENENDTVAGCFSLYTNLGGHKKHAAISNGILKAEACRNVLQNNSIFEIVNDNNYISGEINQVNFLNMFLAKGYTFKDMSQNYSFIFYDGNCDKKYGNGKTLVRPIK
ncbi:MAG: hypothetical protein ACW98X_20115 [Promethearchaeota archaeon]|jgi:hypothetical protein